MEPIQLFTLVLDKNSYIIGGVEKNALEVLDLLSVVHPIILTEYSMPTPEGISKALEIKPYNPLTSESVFLIPRDKIMSMSKTNLTGKMLYYKNTYELDEEKYKQFFIDRDKTTDSELTKYGIINKKSIINKFNRLFNEDVDKEN